jgi:hypothetical protein
MKLQKSSRTRPSSIPLFFLFGQASEALRLDIEADYKTALDIAEMVRKRLVKASQSGTVDPSMIWALAQSFGAAKLDLGEELPAVVEHVIEQVGAANASDDGVRDVGDSLWPFGSSCSAQLPERSGGHLSICSR